MKHKADVCILGGGVMGLASAYYLLKAQKSVVLLEKGGIGQGASGSCDDMICLQSKKIGISLTLAMESLEIYRSLSGELNHELGFETLGGMILIENDKQLKVMEELVRMQNAYGLEVEIAGKDLLRKKQPNVSNAIIASTYCKFDSQVYPLYVLYALLRNALNLGLQVMRDSEVIAIERKGDHWLVSSSADDIECDSVLIAAGAWSKGVASLCDVDVPISPIRGQLVITEPISPIGETNNWSAGYIASKLDKSLMPDKGPYAKEIGLGFSLGRTHHGNYLIGSTREDVGYNKNTSERAISLIMNQAISYFPILSNVHIIRTIAGFRPGTPDGNPIVGPIDGMDGLFIAAGHEGDGIALAPITGKVIADAICGRYVDKRYDILNLRRFQNNKV